MLPKKTLAFIRRKYLLSGEKNVCVALSGGPDSTALLHILCGLKDELEISVSACHVNHSLRGNESDEDEKFCRELAGKLKTPYYTTKVDVKRYRAVKGGSVQSAARELRYLVFDRLIRKKDADVVAIAHTADDNTESLLMNFFRGAGPQGLSGIRPVREGFGIKGALFIRPFMESGKSEIMEYLKENGLAYRTDSSNTDQKYLRNRLRETLLPVIMKGFNPSLHNTLQRSAEILGDIRDYISDAAQSVLEKGDLIFDDGHGGYQLDCDGFRKLPKALQREVMRLIAKKIRKNLLGLSFDNLEALRKLAIGGTGGGLGLRGLNAVCAHGKFYIKKAAFEGNIKDEKEIEHPLCKGIVSVHELGIAVSVEKAQRPLPPFDPACETVYIDADALPKNTVLRNRRQGDLFHSLGAPGKRKLKKFFIDLKVPRWERNSILLLASGNDVLWIAGFRLAESVKVTPESSNILRLKIHVE